MNFHADATCMGCPGSFCSIRRIPEDKRTGAQQALVCNELLQIKCRGLCGEALKCSDGVDREKLLLEACYSLLDALKHYKGYSIRIAYSTSRLLLAALTEHEAAYVYNYNSGAPSDLLSLLTALPAIQNAGIHPKDYDTMQRVSTVALNAIDAERTKWAAALKGSGVSVDFLEVCFRHVYAEYLKEVAYPTPNPQETASFEAEVAKKRARKALRKSLARIYKLAPECAMNTNAWAQLQGDHGTTCEMLRAGLEAADARDDEVDGSLLRWTLCHFLLLRGKTSGFTVQDFLDLVEKAKKCRRIVKSWASADEGIMDNSCKQEHYIYKALGVYERLRAKVKKDPEFAKARLPEYTDQDQENAIEHIRCANPKCAALSEGYRYCGHCLTTVYCSKECQTLHWKAGHKRECKAPAERK